MKELLKKIYNEVIPAHREYKSSIEDNYIKISLIEGAKVEIFGNYDKEYEVNFIDNDSNTNVYRTILRPGLWAMPSPRYFVNWRIEVKCDGKIIKEEILNLNGKRVRIVCDTNSMGDLLAFIGAIDEFQKKHSAEVDCVIFNNHIRKIFEDSYTNIKFLAVNHTDPSYYAQYKIGYFFSWNEGWAKNDPRSIPLTSIAPSVLGLEVKEYKPKLKFKKDRLTDKKYVCIGIQSTAQCKYWNNPNGWNDVVKYINSLGYEVWCIDKSSSFGSGNYMNYMPQGVVDKTGEFSLEERMQQLAGAEFFIGIGSGLSWLAWSVGIKVVLVSGFSKTFAEFNTPYRVINENVCNGCWNDASHIFDKTKWEWCPRDKDFECSKKITSEMVIRNINNLVNKPNPPEKKSAVIITSHANTTEKRSVLIECINSIRKYSNMKIILSSNTSVSEDIQKQCDYVVFDKENPILPKEEYEKYGLAYYYWESVGGEIKHRQVPFDYGYAVYMLQKNGLDLAKGLGFEKLHVVNYDYEFGETLLFENEMLLEEYESVFYRFDDTAFDNIPAYVSAFFSIKTNALIKILEYYKSKDEYYSEDRINKLNLLETQIYHIANNKLGLKSKEIHEKVLSTKMVTNKMVVANEDKDLLRYWKYDIDENKLHFIFNKTVDSTKIIVKDSTTNLECFCWNSNKFEKSIQYYLIPNQSAISIGKNFSGFIFEIYINDKLVCKNNLFIQGSENERKNEIVYVGNTEDNFGIKYRLVNDGSNYDVNVKIVDPFTGFVFYSQDSTINNQCIYYFSHAYKLPNQSFRVYEKKSGKLLLEKILNEDLEYDKNIFREENRNLISRVDGDMKNSQIFGQSYFELYCKNVYNIGKCKIEEDDIVFDLGANCGMFARYCFTNKAKKVYSFEPTPELQRWYEKMNAEFNYVFTPKAVYSRPIKFIKHKNPLESHVEESDEGSDGFVNLNDFIRSNNIEKIDYLKVDIEGSEYDFFKTIDKNYLKNNVRKIALEFHNNTERRLSEILDVLYECGYSVQFADSDSIDSILGMLYAVK
jgi:autotransporter strand-loop-strand O-heptosyltransferase